MVKVEVKPKTVSFPQVTGPKTLFKCHYGLIDRFQKERSSFVMTSTLNTASVNERYLQTTQPPAKTHEWRTRRINVSECFELKDH